MKNSLRRIFALALVVMMIASLGMSAFAEGEGESEAAAFEVSFNKTLNKGANDFAPDATYSFTVVPYAAPDTASGTINNPYAGPAGGVTISDVTSAPEAGDIAAAGEEAITTVVDTGKISVFLSKFTKPGIFRYTVTENDPAYSGISKDPNPQTLDIYVEYNKDGALTITGAVLYKQTSHPNCNNYYSGG